MNNILCVCDGSNVIIKRESHTIRLPLVACMCVTRVCNSSLLHSVIVIRGYCAILSSTTISCMHVCNSSLLHSVIVIRGYCAILSSTSQIPRRRLTQVYLYILTCRLTPINQPIACSLTI